MSSAPSAPVVVPEQQAGGGQTATHNVLQTISRFSASTLPYLKALSDGKRALSPDQLAELRASWQQKGEGANIELDHLLKYMASPSSNVVEDAEPLDGSYPISNYFISSSHNTYLTGHQLYGDASTEPYKNVLLRGCRCIEIDVWDGEERKVDSDEEEKEKETSGGLRSHLSKRIARARNKSPSQTDKSVSDEHKIKPWTTASSSTRAEPRVLHGYTLTKEVAFRDVCEAIRDAAFINSDLPVVVSLEVHAGTEQQEIMVEIMRETWKHLLADAPKEELQSLPTPDELRRKLLVKVKAAPAKTPEEPAAEVKKVQSVSSTSSSDAEDEKSAAAKNKKKSKVIDTLSALGIYTRSYHFKSLVSPEAQIPTHVFSLSERRVADVHENDGDTLFTHNRDFLMRTYPSGTRVSSSNLKPLGFWQKGIQMVALNWQKFDAGVMLNEGQFSGTGGWVLKPAGYRGGLKSGESGARESSANTIQYKNLDLTIELLAAQDLPLSKDESRPERVHPYVKCHLHVDKSKNGSHASNETGKKKEESKHKRRSKNGKTTDPDFGGERMQFSGIGVVEELSFVRFKIKDDTLGRDELMAWACVRLDRLKSGHRFVHLLDGKGIESHGVLLVNVIKRLH